MESVADTLYNKFGLIDPDKNVCIKCYEVYLGDTLIAVVPVGMLEGFLSCVFKSDPIDKVSLCEWKTD